MLSLGRSDRVWLIGGLLVIALLAVGGWFLAISPKFAEADEVQAEADSGSIELIKLNKDITALLDLEKNRQQYLAELRTKQQALPSGYDMTAYVRLLQDSGVAVGVLVNGITFSNPGKGKVDRSAEINISLSAEGTPTGISAFLTRIQSVQPRAVLVQSVNLATAKSQKEGAPKENVQASMSLSAFCLAPAKTTITDNCVIG